MYVCVVNAIESKMGSEKEIIMNNKPLFCSILFHPFPSFSLFSLSSTLLFGAMLFLSIDSKRRNKKTNFLTMAINPN
jgi:hypothetical protein